MTSAGGPGAAPAESPVPEGSRWQTVVRATVAVRSTDPALVESALQDLGGRRRWLAPLAFAAGTVAVVFDGVLVLLRNWRLTLLQLVPAVWIWVMTWNLKHHLLSRPTFSAAEVIPIAIGVLLAAQVAYWCNATFAYTMVQTGTGDIRAAFAQARPHWRLVSGLALLTGAAQACIWLLMPHLESKWLWLALLLMFVVQIYLFIAIPCWLLSVRKTGSRRDRTTRTLTTGVLSGVASMPGFLLNRIGLLLLGSGGLTIIGGALVAVGAVLHITASSSVRVVKMSVRLRPPESGGGPAGIIDPPPDGSRP